MCIYPIYSDLDHLELFSWDRTGITNASEGSLCYFSEGIQSSETLIHLCILKLRLVQGLRSHYFFLVCGYWYLFLLWPALLLPALGLSHMQFCYSAAHSCSCMCSVLTIEAGCIWLQHPISTMCQLGLSLPAYVIRGTLILSALQCLWVTLHGHSTDCFSYCLYHFLRTEQVF